ncbi:MAG: cation-translocating P-type ATPase [Nanoarchaeota archaeon]
MDFYMAGKEEVLSSLHTSSAGLPESEASLRLKQYGPNILQKKKEHKILKILINQLNSYVVYILIAALLISFFLGEFIDAYVIAAILVLNTILGFVQEYKADKAIEKLKQLATPVCIVIRDGRQQQISSTELVPGDIVVLEEGSKVPADCYLLEAINLKADESLLTGESVPVKKEISVINKQVQLSSRGNMLFSSTIVSCGRAKAVVISTGMSTEVGKIAHMIQEVEEKETPLQKKLQKLGKFMAFLTVVITLIVFLAGILRGQELFTMFLVAVSLAVAAIPEGLPAVVTICLALGVHRMVKRSVLVRKLSSVETLGATTIICCDKTGTLTCNEMTVKKIFFNSKFIDVAGEGYSFDGDFSCSGRKYDKKELQLLMETALLCNNSKIGKGKVIGDPTEGALVVAANKASVVAPYARLDEIPFTSESKFMATLNAVGKKKIWHFKGAAEVILGKCSWILINGKKFRLTSEMRKEILNANNIMAEEALRVLAFAYSESKSDLTFLGLMGMIDPPRPGVPDSIKKCKSAGIRVVMITGDHKLTAQAIARKIGLNTRAITGEEIDSLDDDSLGRIARDIDIYARVNPLHKVRILDALKDGNIIAMTGDGVNDAPALKKADIGVAVGSATDVAKESSDMILLNDDFSSIVHAVEEGRGIYNNIKKFVNYLLSSNFGEVSILFFAMIIGFLDASGNNVIPLLAVQILWINLVTDGLPALALGADPLQKDVMHKPPRNPKEQLITKNMMVNIILIGVLMTVSALFFFSRYLPDVKKAQTMVFTTVVIFEMIRIYMVRSQYRQGIFSNKYLIFAVLTSLVLQAVVIYTPLGKFFRTVPLGLIEIGEIIALGAVVFVIGKIVQPLITRITKQQD